ncbi:Gfo/Idh/MocA family oxidoreductase [Telmatocola sphagniphila]|uniref:Gfo/Idh/MocA family oxidoreductase n=1 Tax=Telmatocola sphagniphila TaxID=1123043 RepID=A0A8E6B8F4_9BACT|nr:Gfo/Idh/MocA family oxidoreductase [Telmatocola sphagniphila]QVL33272.1 Gfo/Idh/MocA family oxidoreductase [Telmatocola sphagniphila]
MLRIGIVGLGFMGMIHYLAGRKVTGAQVTAVCSRDPKKLAGDWTSIRGNFGPPGEQMDLSGIKKYANLEDLLSDPEIDLIDICNPTDQHPHTAIAALKAGKHVLVEKAIALTPEGADAMMAAAKVSGKMLMVAHVLPFFPDFDYARQLISSNKFGKLMAGHFRRIISRPDWSADIGDASKTGGPAVDLHVHDTHFIRLNFGMPKTVSSAGYVEKETVQHLTTTYGYPGGSAITCTSGAVTMKGRPFVHGYELYFEKATIVYESGAIPLTVYQEDGSIDHPNLPGGDPVDSFTAEITEAVNSVLSGKKSALLDGQLARDALVMCHKEIESVRTGKIVSL